MKYSAVVLLLGLCAADQAFAGQPAPVTSPPVCDVLAAVTRVNVLPQPEGDKRFVLTSPAIEFNRYVRGYLDKAVRPPSADMKAMNWRDLHARALGLSMSELQAMQKLAAKRTATGFRPRCSWAAEAPAKFSTIPAFALTNPLFSSDGRLALVQVSQVFNRKQWSIGFLCAMRKSSEGWTGACVNSYAQ